LTSLPPELVGNIYDHLSYEALQPYDGCFLPIAKALLHFQRSNLYKHVLLSHRQLVSKFCVTIIQARPNIGAMVKRLEFGRGSRWDEDRYEGMHFANSGMDQRLRPMLPQLIHLERLTIYSSSIVHSVFTSFDTTPPPSSLFLLDLELDNYSLIDRILPLFPSLRYLRIDVYLDVAGSTEPTIDRIPLDPPRQLRNLHITADSRSKSICNLIASTESKETILRGRRTNLGLASLRNSEVMEELSAYCNREEGEQEVEDFDPSLLKFTSLTKLVLRGTELRLSDRFFTDYFTPALPLQTLHLTRQFALNSPDLIQAFKTKPTSLKSILLDTMADLESFDFEMLMALDEGGIREVVEIYRKAGVTVAGKDVAIVEEIDQARLDQARLDADEDDSFGSSDSEDNEDDEQEEEEDRSE
jgi:hypothetical protein